MNQVWIRSTLTSQWGNLLCRYRMERRRNVHSAPTVAELSNLTHIISSGQFKFLHTFYDPISFVIFSVSSPTVWHGKMKLQRDLVSISIGAKVLPVQSCLWYTVHIVFIALPTTFAAWSMKWLNRTTSKQFENTNVLRQWSGIMQTAAFLGHPAIDPPFLPFSALSLHTSGGGDVKFTTSRRTGLSWWTCFSSLIFSIWGERERCLHTALCETRGSQTDKCRDKIISSITGTFIRLLLMKSFVVERSTGASCDLFKLHFLKCIMYIYYMLSI